MVVVGRVTATPGDYRPFFEITTEIAPMMAMAMAMAIIGKRMSNPPLR